jgi:hypothetical protein
MQDNHPPSEATSAVAGPLPESYIRLCVEHRSCWKKLRPEFGGFYYDLVARRLLVFTGDSSKADGIPDRLVYCPNIAALLEIIDQHLAAGGWVPAAKQFAVKCESGRWAVALHYEGGLTETSGEESLHAALFRVLIQFAAFVRFGLKTE